MKARTASGSTWIGSLALLAALVALWWVASNAGWVSRVFLPTPQATLASLAEGLRADLLDFTWATVSRMLLGSVAQRVLHHAECPVLAVRHPDKRE